MAAIISNAVTSAIAPFQKQIADLENRINHGITPAALGGAQPAPGAVPNLGGEPKPAPIDYKNTNALSLISQGCAEAFKKAGVTAGK